MYPIDTRYKCLFRKQRQEVYTSTNVAVFENNDTLKDFCIVKPNIMSVSRLWLLSKTLRPYASKCQKATLLLNRLFYDTFTKHCHNCNLDIVNNIIHHGILECSSNEQIRFYLWQKLFSITGMELFRQFISLSPRVQLLSLFSGLEEITKNESVVEDCLKAFVSATYLMNIAYISPQT